MRPILSALLVLLVPTLTSADVVGRSEGLSGREPGQVRVAVQLRLLVLEAAPVDIARDRDRLVVRATCRCAHDHLPLPYDPVQATGVDRHRPPPSPPWPRGHGRGPSVPARSARRRTPRSRLSETDLRPGPDRDRGHQRRPSPHLRGSRGGRGHVLGREQPLTARRRDDHGSSGPDTGRGAGRRSTGVRRSRGHVRSPARRDNRVLGRQRSETARSRAAASSCRL